MTLPIPDQFDLEPGTSYLNSAYMGPLPRVSLEAIQASAHLKAQPWRISIGDFFDPLERARELFAGLVGGDAEGVAVIPSVSYGMATAAQNIPLAPGQQVLLLEAQFPSAVYAFAKSASRSGAEIRTVARSDDGDWTRAVLDAIGDQTQVVCLPHCHWTDGGRLDLVRISEATRGSGAALVVDGCQSIGAMPFDVQAIRPDFLITASYKWLLGPYSLGFMWVAPERRSGEPIENNWIARENSHDFASLVHYRDRYQPGARRFDVGEPSNFILLPSAIRSMELIQEIGVDAIAAHGRTLIDDICARAQGLGLDVVPQAHRSPHLTGLGLGDRDPSAIAEALKKKQVFVSVRGRSVRVSAHLYNTADDVDRLFDALANGLR